MIVKIGKALAVIGMGAAVFALVVIGAIAFTIDPQSPIIDRMMRLIEILLWVAGVGAATGVVGCSMWRGK